MRKRILMRFALVLLTAQSLSYLITQDVWANWGIQTIDSTGDVGKYTSVVLDNEQNPYIGYYDVTNGNLKFIRWTDFEWVRADATPGFEMVDSTGKVGRYSCIALDNDGKPYVSYYDDTNGDLRFARWDGSKWIIETVDSTGDVGKYTSLALDGNNNPYMSYYDNINGDLRFTRWDGFHWVKADGTAGFEVVDSTGDVGRYTSITLDNDNNPCISYYDDTNGNLKFARWDGSEWIAEPVDSDGDVGKYSSLALDSDGNPYISYYDDINGDLRFSRLDGEQWLTESVDSAGDVGKYSSIILDTKGNLCISYYGNGHLKLARRTGFQWVTETIDSTRDVGEYTSIALDTKGNPYISYYDSRDGNLKFAKWTRNLTLGWTDETGYESDGLEPDIGRALVTTFTYRVKYVADVDRDAPKPGYPKVHIKKSGLEISGTPFWMEEVDTEDTTYIDGKLYTYSIMLSTGTDYTYYFEAYDIWNSSATGPPTTPMPGPEVSVTYSIQGWVLDESDRGISGVTINLSGYVSGSIVSGTYTTQASGYYKFVGVPRGGDYTVTPSKAGYTFEPPSISTTSLNGNLDNQNFIGTPLTYYIKGYVRDSEGVGIEEVRMDLTGATEKVTHTNADGYYEFSGLVSGNYTVTPSKEGYSFSPPQRSYSPLDANKDNQNFVGTVGAEIEVRGGEGGYLDPEKNEKATIILRPTASGEVKITIYTLRGQPVWEREIAVSAGSERHISWACENSYREKVASGIYVVHIKGIGIDRKKKIAVVR